MRAGNASLILGDNRITMAFPFPKVLRRHHKKPADAAQKPAASAPAVAPAPQQSSAPPPPPPPAAGQGRPLDEYGEMIHQKLGFLTGEIGDLEKDLEERVDAHTPRSLEDLPEDVRHQLNMIASVPEDASAGRKMFDIVENGALDAYGNLERVKLLHFLSQYPVKAYTYQVSDNVERGERPSVAKLKKMYEEEGITDTINLCAEMNEGDQPNIDAAGLTGKIATHHIGVADMTQPTVDQVLQMLAICADPSKKVYVHCEAGKARTGVMMACYRMAVQGWSADDALTEAKNFGCSVPMQQEFIKQFGAMLKAHYEDPSAFPELGKFPLEEPGSYQPSAEELSQTLDAVSASEAGTIQ